MAPPWETASSKALVGRRNATADQALSRATSMLPSCEPSMRCIMTIWPPESRMMITWLQLFFLASASLRIRPATSTPTRSAVIDSRRSRL